MPDYASSRTSRASAKATRKRYQRLISTATELSAAIGEAIDFSDHILIALKLGDADGAIPIRDRRAYFTDKIVEHREFLSALIASASTIRKQSQSTPGRPRNVIAYLVLRDIAAIFEWVTRGKASRLVDRVKGMETGAFYLFSSTIWPIIFSSADDGLPAAMKNWASARRKYGESSALIANINLRHPSWRVFDS